MTEGSDAYGMSREDIIQSLLEKAYYDDNSLSIDDQFDLRITLFGMTADQLIEYSSKEGFSDLGELKSLFGFNGTCSKPDPKDIKLISILQYMPDGDLSRLVNCDDLKTYIDHLYDFYISDDSGAIYREYFDKGNILLLLDYLKKSDEIHQELILSDFRDSRTSSLEELVNLNSDAKESCIDYIWDNDITGEGDIDISIKFMIFALKKVSSDHERLTRRLAGTLLKSINYDQKVITTWIGGDRGDDTENCGVSDMKSDSIPGSYTRDQLINAMVNEWIVDCYCAPEEDDDHPEVKRKEFEAMTNSELLERFNFDDDYTFDDYMGTYEVISEEYMRAFESPADDINEREDHKRSPVGRIVDLLKRIKNKF